jgi:hypothetical protein
MFIKVTQSGARRYAQLVESFRNVDGKPRQRTVCTLGRLEDGGEVDTLIASLQRARGVTPTASPLMDCALPRVAMRATSGPCLNSGAPLGLMTWRAPGAALRPRLMCWRVCASWSSIACVIQAASWAYYAGCKP